MQPFHYRFWIVEVFQAYSLLALEHVKSHCTCFWHYPFFSNVSLSLQQTIHTSPAKRDDLVKMGSVKLPKTWKHSPRSPDCYLCKMQWHPMKVIVWCHSQQISGKQGHCTKFTPLLTRQHTEPDQATLIHWRCLGPQGWSASTSSYKWTAMATRLIGGHNTFRMKNMKSQKNVYFSWDCQVTELKCFHVLAL